MYIKYLCQEVINMASEFSFQLGSVLMQTARRQEDPGEGYTVDQLRDMMWLGPDSDGGSVFIQNVPYVLPFPYAAPPPLGAAASGYTFSPASVNDTLPPVPTRVVAA